MKTSYVFVIIIFLINVSSSIAQKTARVEVSQRLSSENTTETANISFEKEVFDFGEIPIGEPAEVTFEFENTGQIPLIIKEVKTSCGCTVTTYPKEAVGVGEKAAINAKYEAKTLGYFSKSITVKSNTEEGYHQLTIKGIVVASKK